MATYRSVKTAVSLQGPDTSDVSARVLDAARAHFARRGYNGASLREIAAEARVTKPSIYYHFQSKQGLYEAVLAAAHAGFEQVCEACHQPGLNVRDRLVALMRAHLEFVRIVANPASLAEAGYHASTRGWGGRWIDSSDPFAHLMARCGEWRDRDRPGR